MKRPCRKSGCTILTDDKSGYCDKHRQNVNKVYREQRTDLAEQSFYRSSRWTETSKQYRAVHPLCECGCGKPSRMVHHTTELSKLLQLGLDPCDWKYLQALSWGCHEKTKKQGGRG